MPPRRSDAITFVVFTYNEAERIGRVIRNFKPFGDILIVDNYSADDTVKIAESEGCAILLNKNAGWVEDILTTSRVKDAVKTDWIYWAFADEMVDSGTLTEIITNIDSNKYDIVNITRKNYYYGQFLEKAYADRLNRIFRKNAIDFTGNTIHLFGKPTVPVERIKILPDSYFVHHFVSNTTKSYVGTIDRYTDIETEKASSTAGNWRLIAGSMRRFLGNYFIRGGYKAGPAGLYLSLLMLFYPLIAMMKQYEKKMGIDRTEIERLNDKKRDSILENLKRS